MKINDDLLSQANQILVSLLAACSEADSTKFLNRDPRLLSDFDNIARAVTQLIEICSWMGIISLVRPDLELIMSYMQTVSTEDKANIKTHPSRLKSLLLFGGYNKNTLAASLQQLCSDKEIYCTTPFSIEHLAFIDFLGLYLELVSRKQLSPEFKSAHLLKKVRAIRNRELMNILEIIKDGRKLTKLESKSLSYLSWILVVNKTDNDYPWVKGRLHSIQKILQRKMSEHSIKGHLSKYEKWSFPEISYGYIALFLFQRIWNWTAKEDSVYLQWLKVCAKEMRSLEDPYHACLLVKQVIQARKDEFIDLFKKNAYAALRNSVLFDVHTAIDSTSDLVKEAMRNAIPIEIKNQTKLTAGWSQADVFKVKAQIHSLTSDKSDSPSGAEYVVKLARQSNITHASEIYLNVPEAAQRLFVRHQSKLYQGTVGDEGKHFIVMEYLSEFKELATLLKSILPIDKTAHFDKNKLRQTVEASLKLIKDLHEVKSIPNPIFKPAKPLRVKVAELFESEYQISRRHLVLRNILENGKQIITQNGMYQIDPFGKIVVKLLKYHHILTKPRPQEKKRDKFRLVHGDCHALNIILKHDYSEGRFIDIADVHLDDYLEDYASLCSHVCFSMNLEHLGNVDLRSFVNFGSDPSKSESLEKLYVEKREALEILWKEILKVAESEAITINDLHWRARICLLIGRRLLFIASKSASPLKSYVLLLQGSFLLQQISNRLPMLGKDISKELFVPPGNLSMTIK